MLTILEVLWWLLGEVFCKLVVPYVVIFGIIGGTIRFLMPTWQTPATVQRLRPLYRIFRSFFWGLDLGWGNNNRRGWFLFPVLIPFVLYWGLSQPMGPPTLRHTIEQAKELLPAAERMRKDYAPSVREQAKGTLHAFQRFFLGKQEADQRMAERKATAVKIAQEAEKREAAVLKERRNDWSRWYVGIAVSIIYIPFVGFYALLAGREEVSGWAERIVASRRTQQGSTPAVPLATGAPATSPAAATGPGNTASRILGFLGLFEIAEALLHFYRLMPGGRR